jgi:hypothetical protein
MTNNKQQTAVEYYTVNLINILGDEINSKITYEQNERIARLEKQVKSLEKERMKEAMHMQVKKYTTAYLDEDGNPQLSYDIQDSFKDHWNETYGGAER